MAIIWGLQPVGRPESKSKEGDAVWASLYGYTVLHAHLTDSGLTSLQPLPPVLPPSPLLLHSCLDPFRLRVGSPHPLPLFSVELPCPSSFHLNLGELLERGRHKRVGVATATTPISRTSHVGEELCVASVDSAGNWLRSCG